jgi:predicted Zn-dependent peptidase
MSRRLLLLLILMLAVALLSGCAGFGRTGADPRAMTFPLIKFEVPKSERFEYHNGMIVHLITDRELPLVSITAYVNTGSMYEPADKVGLAGLTGAVMRSGGTEKTPVEKLDAELEFMASSVESFIGGDLGNVSMTTLKRNLDRTLDLFGQVLITPAFREDRLELAKKRTIEGLRRQNDDPKGIADRELNRALYADHPFGRTPTMEGIKQITRDDLVKFHQRYYAPNNLILAVAGDVDKNELLIRLGKVFNSWPRKQLDFPPVAAPKTDLPPQVLFAHKDVNQSVIRMGYPGVDKNNPDIHKLRVLDYILGLGFTSRLMTEVRSNQGLAYHVDGYFDVGRRFTGVYKAVTETKSEATVKATTLIRDIIGGMAKAPVTDQELSLAKDAIINSFIFGFVKPDAVVNQRARLEYYGYPEGYLENYRDNIAKVTREDVLQAAKTYLHPDKFTIMVVGDEKKFDQPLSTLGPVKELKLEIK